MNNAIFKFDSPQNEPILQYGKGSKEREQIISELNRISSEQIKFR